MQLNESMDFGFLIGCTEDLPNNDATQPGSEAGVSAQTQQHAQRGCVAGAGRIVFANTK